MGGNNMQKTVGTALAMSLAVAMMGSGVEDEPKTPPAVDMVKRAEELRKLRWGLFVCWSFATFTNPKQEWPKGIKDASFFTAKGVDTDQWVKTAKDAEMGYILFLTRHIDGFCLWDTRTTDRKVTKSPLGLDVLAELRKSCDKYGIKLALYFAEGDLKENYYPGPYTVEMKKAQLKELLTQYGRIEFIWFDNFNPPPGMDHDQTTAYCHEFQPSTLVGYNIPPKSGEVEIRERGSAHPLDPKSGYLIAEFTYPILPDRMFHPKWFYHISDEDTPSHIPRKIYRDYAQAAKNGVLFSLDVGPDHNGKLRKLDVDTLRKVGDMIRNPPQPPNPAPVSQGKPAKASSDWNPSYDAAKAFDGDEFTRWRAAKDNKSGWIEVDLQKDTKIDRAYINQIDYDRIADVATIEEFAIEYKDGDKWKEIVRGTSIGAERELRFNPVSARFVRLNIIRARQVPTIWEFQVYESQK